MFCTNHCNKATLTVPVPATMLTFSFWVQWWQTTYILHFRYPLGESLLNMMVNDIAKSWNWHSRMKSRALPCCAGHYTILPQPYIADPVSLFTALYPKICKRSTQIPEQLPDSLPQRTKVTCNVETLKHKVIFALWRTNSLVLCWRNMWQVIVLYCSKFCATSNSIMVM
jgi:hypothetical protein